ncbi:MAG: signal peptidase II [Candidatus Woesearchaeota archaeon]|jgi:signal peptidase II|nr:signal peptidase II [Candidatus Woesearchaeota archaeon]
MKKDKYTLFEISLIIFFLTIIDLITKFIFTDKSFFEGFLISLNYTKNYGSSFGIFSNVLYYNLFVIVLSVIVLFVILYLYKYFINNKNLKLIFVFFVAGILGNTFDRIFYGYVRDFISLKYLFIFNIADLYFTLAFIFYLIYEYVNKGKTSD